MADKIRHHVDVSEVARRYGRHLVTLSRWERLGILPPSHRVGGRRAWYEDQLLECDRRLAELEQARAPKTREQARALAATGRAAKAEKKRLRDAAAKVLEIGGAGLLIIVLAKFTKDGHLDLILPEHRQEAIKELEDTIGLFGEGAR